MSTSPRVVIGVPVYGKADFLESAVRSLLAQTFEDFRVLLIDDRSPDGSLELARRLAAADPRVEVHENRERLGMLGNTNLALRLARERFPEAEYWALGSDHDLWHPRFLESLVALLDGHPDAVLAYPLAQRIDEHGMPYPGGKTPRPFATLGEHDPAARLRLAFRGMSAGNMIYGLFRTAALGDRLYRPVLVPDRLLLAELALRGPFAVAPEVLWQRRFRGLAGLDRQRAVFFRDGVPRYARLPWWLQHAGALAWDYVVRGDGARIGVGRRRGAALAGAYLRLALELRARRRWARVRRRVRRWAPRRVALRVAARVGPHVGPRARRGLARLERTPALRPLAVRVLGPAFARVSARLSGEAS